MTTDMSGVRMSGPLVRFGAGFAENLAAGGYSPLSAANQLRLMAHLSRWMLSEGLEPEALSAERVEAFLEARRSSGYSCWLSQRGVAPLLGYLRSLAVVPVQPVLARPGRWEELVDNYGSYLAAERGIVPESVVAYVRLARRFLSDHDQSGAEGLETLGAAAVTGFVLRQCQGVAIGTAKLTVVQLRSLLRFLYMEGYTATDLSQLVPAVAGWRNAGIPKYLEPKQLQAVLRSCDRRKVNGRRDFAILMLMARLGLRRGEVAALDLEDLDWRAGEILVRGKGRRDERLPLPGDVGEAVAAYLRRGRRRDRPTRALFLATRAPYGRLSPSAVTHVVSHASVQAGLGPIGAHRLRHTAATEMLRAGASLSDVGQVLRHRHLSTTAIYAKVDNRSLGELARPWPVVSRSESPRADLHDLALVWPGALA